MKTNFFIDTADITYINNTWEKLSNHFSGKELVGITTNPSAMNKVNAHTIKEMATYASELCKIVSNIRQDKLGVVYVQGPNSNMGINEQLKYAEMISGWSDGQTKIGLKIPPFSNLLNKDNIKALSKLVDVNVTGVADASTALLCLSYDIRYVSIIPGRMEERGVNAKEQISFVNARNIRSKSEIITGSMRTLEGLRWAIEYNTVPTIGARVLDLIVENDKSIKNFKSMFKKKYINNTVVEHSPLVTQDMLNLSEEFFVQ